ncbi:MAG: restriction endonuclease [Firmicutes bacterium]|nr:restriction endonuclease [Bacillota bacterium]
MELDFIEVFNKKLEEKNIDWEVSALISPDGRLFSLGSDSKLIGRIFELICYNILQEIADENGLILHPSEAQTVYPDFTLMRSTDDKKKIAVDIKTTYRKFLKSGVPSGYVFTLGSYASYMRDGKKNISYPYNEYAKHYVIGFIYTRNENASEGKVFSINDLSELPVPYKDVEVFVQEKYKIAGDRPGSRNTENIGSFKTNRIDYLVNGEGPFSELGIEIYEDYWRGFKKYREESKYTSLEGYLELQEGSNGEALRKIYELWKEKHCKLNSVDQADNSGIAGGSP